jgi:hypothetical protein
MLFSGLVVALLGVVSPSDEHQVRQYAPVFGQRGQLVLRGATNANVLGVHESVTTPAGEMTANLVSFVVEPSMGLFVIDNLYVGGLIDVGYRYSGGAYNLTAGVGPTVGYRVPISANTSFFPTLSALYEFNRMQVKTTTALGVTQHAHYDGQEVNLRVRADFVFHLAHRVSLTAGPFVEQSVYAHDMNKNQPWTTTYGLAAGVLAWL